MQILNTETRSLLFSIVKPTSRLSWTFAPTTIIPRGVPCWSTCKWIFVPERPLSVGFAPRPSAASFFCANRCLNQRAVHRLPGKMKTLLAMIIFQAYFHQLVKDSMFRPSAIVLMNSTFWSIAFWDHTPLTTCFQTEDDTVHYVSRGYRRTSARTLSLERLKERLKFCPQPVRQFGEIIRRTHAQIIKGN